jgi:membrane protein required for colicin V production
MPLTILDLAVLGVVLISALLAMVRGFTREVLSIASWVAAAVAALMFHPTALPYMQPYISNPTAALIAAIAAVFLVTLVLVSLVTIKLSDLVLDSKIGALDRALGFVFGAARGGLICVVAYLFFAWLVPDQRHPTWVRDAKAKPLLESTGDSLLAMLPDDPEGTILQRFKKRPLEGGAEPAEPEGDPKAGAPAAPAPAPVPQRRSQIFAPGALPAGVAARQG